MTRWEQFKDIPIEDLYRWLEADEQLLKGRKQLLDAIPECPRHGHDCVPHALDWIESLRVVRQGAMSRRELAHFGENPSSGCMDCPYHICEGCLFPLRVCWKRAISGTEYTVKDVYDLLRSFSTSKTEARQ